MKNGNSNTSEIPGTADPGKATPKSNMSGLSSYCMKTVVMLMLKSDNSNTKWKESDAVALLFEVDWSMCQSLAIQID